MERREVGDMLKFGYLFLICCAMLVQFQSSSETVQTPKGRSYYEKQGHVVWEVSTNQKVIALTFDDGPFVNNTPQVLDLLQQYNAKATFFPVGNRVLRYPELVTREVEEGHEIANHTYNHPVMEKITTEKLVEELEAASNAIRETTGYVPTLFRPPGGVYNDTIVNAAKASHYMVVIWSSNLDTRDWSRPGVHKIINCVLSNARNGSIVLFHDRERQTLEALKVILPTLQKQGYQFVTVSELLRLRNVKDS